MAQLPTTSHDDLVAAIDSFQLQRATATGNAIVVSLATLFPDAGIDVSQFGPQSRQRGISLDQAGKQPKDFTPVAPGSYTSAAIIMLTDGQRTTGVDPLDAAKAAADRGVRVYTVGIGTVDGETIGFEGWSMRVRLDEETLKAVANKTSAEYFYAGTATDLKKVYNTLSSRLTVEKKETEISALFALGRGRAGAAVGRAVAALVQPHSLGRSSCSGRRRREQSSIGPVAKKGDPDVRSDRQGRARHRRQRRHRPGHGAGTGQGRRARGDRGAQRGQVRGRRGGAAGRGQRQLRAGGRCRRRGSGAASCSTKSRPVAAGWTS